MPPVNGVPVFAALIIKSIITKLGCVTSVNIWKQSEESCVARYRHVHLSPDFTSQEFGKEPNVSTDL